MITEIIKGAELIARDIAPKATGNLAFNSITSRVIGNGGVIHYSGVIAPYTKYLENLERLGHKNFIKGATYSAIMQYVYSTKNNSMPDLSIVRQRVDTASADTWERRKRMLYSIGGAERVPRRFT